MGKTKVIYDNDGNVIDIIEESDEIVSMLEPEKDPYWKSPIPKKERRHKRDTVEESKAMKRFKIGLLTIGPLIILALLYYIVIQFI